MAKYKRFDPRNKKDERFKKKNRNKFKEQPYEDKRARKYSEYEQI